MPPTGLSTSMGRHHGRQVRTVGDSQRVRHRPDRILTGRRPQSPDKGGKAAISSRHCLRDSLPPQKAGHRTGFRSAPSVPLPRIFSSQALGKITDDPKPKGHQPVHPASALPDGNTGCDPAHVETGRLGRVHRFIGRVPPRPHRPPVSEASRLFVRGQGVPIQSPPLRPKARPPAVHPADFSGCGLPPGTRHKGVLLFRRLADRRKHPTPPHSTPGFYPGASPEPRFPNKLGKIGSHSDSAPRVSGGRDRHAEPARPSDSGESRKNFGSGKGPKGPGDGSRQNLDAVLRLPGKPSRGPTRLPSVHETSADTFSPLLSAQRGPAFTRGPGYRFHSPPAGAVAAAPFSHAGQAAHLTPTRDYGDDRCVTAGMGGGMRGIDGERGLVAPLTSPAYKSARVQGRDVSVQTLPVTTRGQGGVDSDGQYHCRVVHQQAGRNALDSAQSACDPILELVSRTSHYPHGILPPRGGEPGGGFPIAGQGVAVRVDVAPPGHEPNSEGIRPPSGRPLRVESELPDTAILLPIEGSGSVESGRIFLSLGKHSGVCVPPDSPHSSCPPQDTGGQDDGSVDSPLVAQEALVSGIGESTGSTAQIPTGSSGCNQAAVIPHAAQEPDTVAPNCVAIVGQESRDAGLSERAAEFIAHSLRESTRESYDSRLTGYFAWCEDKALNPRAAPLNRMIDFFIHLFDKGLALSTISSYRSAIALIHKGFEDGSIVSNAPSLTKLFKAFFLKRPKLKKLLPSWSLPRVLEALAKRPFEPMAKASLIDLTVKTAFLTAIASGQRRSTLHALSTAPGHIRWERDGVRLIPRPDFIAKNQTATGKSIEIFIKPITALSSIEEDKLWCPVRALKWYLNRTKERRKFEQLFLTCKEPFTPASKDTVSRWIVRAIKAAGQTALVTDSAPHAHETRGVSTSWAMFAGVSQEEILQAAFWSTPNTFISCYLKDVPASEAAFSQAALTSAARSARSSSM